MVGLSGCRLDFLHTTTVLVMGGERLGDRAQYKLTLGRNVCPVTLFHHLASSAYNWISLGMDGVLSRRVDHVSYTTTTTTTPSVGPSRVINKHLLADIV